MPLPYEKLTQILGMEATDYPPEHETTPEFMNKKFNELLVNDKELLKQINDLEGKNYITSGGGISEYDEPTKPSDYTADAFSVRRLRKCEIVGASAYGYWANIVGLRGHGIGNCFELAFTNDGKLIYRKQNTEDAWNDWQQIATVTQMQAMIDANNA